MTSTGAGDQEYRVYVGDDGTYLLVGPLGRVPCEGRLDAAFALAAFRDAPEGEREAMYAREVALYMSVRPAMEIGFPLWAKGRVEFRNTHRLTSDEATAYAQLGLIDNITPASVSNPSNSQASQGLGHDARITKLGLTVASLLQPKSG